MPQNAQPLLQVSDLTKSYEANEAHSSSITRFPA